MHRPLHVARKFALPGAVTFAARMARPPPPMAAPSPLPSPSAPVKVRTKFPESWIFTTIVSGSKTKLMKVKHTPQSFPWFASVGSGAGGGVNGVPGMPGPPPPPPLPAPPMGSGAPSNMPITIRTEFPEAWIVIALDTKYVRLAQFENCWTHSGWQLKFIFSLTFLLYPRKKQRVL
ncbi:unnamed protein product [Strongylus vulgaris]|uniref:Uncharacterized protein n=1 Tax=Strongylus vulgaris TaxID=40348 RepID=A0A3P7J8W6_STRVU|nr:unnamed protein product [Strongylus vulgaris]